MIKRIDTISRAFNIIFKIPICNNNIIVVVKGTQVECKTKLFYETWDYF